MCYTIIGSKGGDIMNTKPYFEVQTITMKGNKRVEHSENLKKIKLPFYCYYSTDGGKTKVLGIVDWSLANKGFYLQSHAEQSFHGTGTVGRSEKLEDLIKVFGINTIKVKIIVYE